MEEAYGIHVLSDEEDLKWFLRDGSIPDEAQVLIMQPDKARSMAEELVAATRKNPQLIALVVNTQ